MNQNTYYQNGQYYTTGPQLSSLNWMLGGSPIPQNPQLLDSYVRAGLITPIGAPTQQAAPKPSFQRQPFTPNQATMNQLAAFGNGVPQWTMDDYTRKITQMGGNANPPVPFAVTPSGFPGGGKTGPAQGGQ